MPPDPGNAWRPSPRIRPVAPRNRQVPFGRTTEEFFVEGEQHEATQWEDANLPPDDEPEPKRWRGRIDKVPRQRGAMVALAVFAVCLVLGVAAGVSALLKTGPHVEDIVAAVKSMLPMSLQPGSSSSTSLPAPEASQGAPTAQTESQPQLPMQSQAQAPSPAQASLAQVLPQSLPQPAPQPAPSQPASPRPSENPVAVPPAPGPVPIPAIVPAAPPSPTKSSAAAGRGAPARTTSAPQPARRAERAATPKRAHQPQSRDNYVWSPELNALVPASSMSEADQAASRPSEVSKPEVDTSSVTKAIRGLPNPFEKDGLAPPPMPAKAMIAPATTGAAAQERPAPGSDDADPFQK